MRDTIIHGDALEVLNTLPENSVDAVVTDPPAGISFMGRAFDSNRGGRTQWVAWLSSIMSECLRILKPGGHALVWSLPRTSHWTGWALEEAGFEIRDCIYHLFGSGFPKSLDISKAIDKMAPRQGMFTAFAEHFKTQRLASGLSQKQIAQHFPSKTGGMTGCVWNWENGANVPTVEQWHILQPMLNLSDEYTALIERVETDREVLGSYHAATSIYGTEMAKKTADITTPATLKAQEWDGWGTALKPSVECWWLCRKPLVESSVAANVLKYRTGGININANRIGLEGMEDHRTAGNGAIGTQHGIYHSSKEPVNSKQIARAESGLNPRYDPQGRFPSHLLLSHSVWCISRGMKRVKANGGGQANNPDDTTTRNAYGVYTHRSPVIHQDADGMEEIEDWECHESCPIYQLDLQSGIRKTGKKEPHHRDGRNGLFGLPSGTAFYDAQGYASRYYTQFHPLDGLDVPFFYTTKASNDDRSAKGMVKNTHPTCKNTSLMRWLCRLITPPDGLVLDCFAGSGSTLVACVKEGYHFIGIEQQDTEDEPYVTIAKQRVHYAQGLWSVA